jgi:adenosylmethionine-8-amino-7-oxononanoate aminotransferase
MEDSTLAIWNPDTLRAEDRAHLLHPLQHPMDHATPHIWVKGQGCVLTNIDGREYLDGLSCLWNVNVGHGRKMKLPIAPAPSTASFSNASRSLRLRLGSDLLHLAPIRLQQTAHIPRPDV